MKTWLIGLGLAQALVTGSVLAGSDIDRYALEPCINGGVSATGVFASQAEEDAYLSAQRARELALEPCINGDVSATGLFATQAEEDLRLERIADN